MTTGPRMALPLALCDQCGRLVPITTADRYRVHRVEANPDAAYCPNSGKRRAVGARVL